MGDFDDRDVFNDPQLPKRVEPSLPVPPIIRKEAEEKKKQQEQKKKALPKEEVKDHFKELSYAVDQIHEILIKNKSPFRFCIYRDNGEVMIDIVKLNDKGEILRTEQKNITHDNFIALVRSIESGEGLLFDFNA